jgi:hypothetical protein
MSYSPDAFSGDHRITCWYGLEHSVGMVNSVKTETLERHDAPTQRPLNPRDGWAIRFSLTG